MKFIWTKTGDYLEVDVNSPELLHHWLTELPSNRFDLRDDMFPYSSIEKFKTSMEVIGRVFKERFRIDTFDHKIPMDHSSLNKLHRTWADIQLQYPSLPIILQKMSDDILTHFYDINLAFHEIEHGCRVSYVEQHSKGVFRHQLPGIEDPERFLSHGYSHIRLEYWGLGRSDYDSWKHNDRDAFIDNFSCLPPSIDVGLTQKPHVAPFPADYVRWMKDQGKTPVGSYMPIGNFRNYTESMGNLIDLFSRNNKIKQHIELVI